MRRYDVKDTRGDRHVFSRTAVARSKVNGFGNCRRGGFRL